MGALQRICTIHDSAALPKPAASLTELSTFCAQGVPHIMIESEGITEQVAAPRYDVAAAIVEGVGLENVMFEAADPEVFSW